MLSLKANYSSMTFREVPLARTDHREGPTHQAHRVELAQRLSAQTGAMTTAVVAEIEARHPWYASLRAEERSWINVLATNGITGFVSWFVENADVDPGALFDAAPRALVRTISLRQTVDLVRTTVDVVEAQIGLLMSGKDRRDLQAAIIHYSREIAFASAEVYARAAESRVSWDDRMEAMIVDAIVRDNDSQEIVSQAATLGWDTRATIAIAAGPVTDSGDDNGLRAEAEKADLTIMTATHGELLVIVVSRATDEDQEVDPIAWVRPLTEHFGPGTIVVGPPVNGLGNAATSADAALSGARVAAGWAKAPRLVTARDVLPERLLSGNMQARKELIESIFTPLVGAGGDLLETADSFLEHSNSVEATARHLFVHPNTVRYRLRRIDEVTGCSLSNARDAYTLRLALSVGRLP